MVQFKGREGRIFYEIFFLETSIFLHNWPASFYKFLLGAYIIQMQRTQIKSKFSPKIYAPIRESKQKLQGLVYKAQAVEESLEALQRQFADTKMQVERAQADFVLMKNSQSRTSPLNLATRDIGSLNSAVVDNVEEETDEKDDQLANVERFSPTQAKRLKQLDEAKSALKTAREEAEKAGVDPALLHETKCEVCHVKLDMNQANLAKHYISSSHVKRIEKLGELRKVLERAKQEAEEQGVAADLLQEHKCGVCNTQLDSPTIAIAHYSSPAHSKRLGRVGQEEGVVERARRDAKKLGLGSAIVLELLEERR